MQVSISKIILAAVTLEPDKVAGSIPTFIVSEREEQQKISQYLGRILEGVVHDLENGVFIIVKH
ncbi:capping complex subunit for YIEGIA [Candidatus Contubernalis alkaliaceticus]|uniref:capping complex subunit for YIEGIA n=1 Tax=Candidatus Contubernalis alkaliaceticus TaxID=338645 RepID=UPI001F4C1DD4|nr:hypothetical protein [Candidatus Contubernalis alkalaceticus]UNC92476.1 hypothetical protein HUE98_10435 [Candidatus Contubernalis alkalaceticus]